MEWNGADQRETTAVIQSHIYGMSVLIKHAGQNRAADPLLQTPSIYYNAVKDTKSLRSKFTEQLSPFSCLFCKVTCIIVGQEARNYWHIVPEVDLNYDIFQNSPPKMVKRGS